MRHDAEAIEIKEPPIQELNKKSSCLRRTCFTGCGSVLAVIIGLALIIKFWSNNATQEVRGVPDYFPASIPVYDKNNINRISITSGKDRGWFMKIAVYVPNAIRQMLENQKELSSSTVKMLANILPTAASIARDTVEIEWTDLPAEPNFVENYYHAALMKNGFTAALANETGSVREFTFHNADIDGSFFLRDSKDKPGTDFVTLKVRFPSH